ncbi:MAG TPA: type II toxin-antitoxin system RelE/ParE family toxin [Cyanobacteria bacterium UBA11370]|nr:type II toxin-antitoxin system RelE/ParE family toxin [Cyanobacteria bacterium UBA11370]HBY80013.1 type II toxin-antitoxin system RelE/ParE family toxin [Cyanobacteria bacterium UBA11148]
MPRVVWTRPALAALDRHRQFLAEIDPNLAVRAIQKIVEMGESLQTYPQRGAIIEQANGLRKLIVTFGKVGFVLHYAILNDEVVILQVYHGRQQRPT